jgi:hypothetical protein
MDTVLDLAKVVIPAAATLVGLYFANAFKRRTRQEVLGRRVDAYVAFWPVTNVAASTTEPYFANVGENEIAFLRFCDIDVDRAPWNKWLKRKDELSGNGGDAARL